MLSVGGYHTCGVTTAGAAYCWGYNFHGQLGDGTTTDRWSPVAVRGGLTFTSVTVGTAHTCGLTTSGKAYCWGSNSAGQLGNPGLIDRTSPEAVPDGQFLSLSAGADHTCAVATDNTVSCWGHNGYGELGDGTTLNRWQPALVHGLVPGKRVELSTGSFYTCAVTDGYAAYCWGSNIEGQLGDGTTTDRSMPVRVVPPV